MTVGLRRGDREHEQDHKDGRDSGLKLRQVPLEKPQPAAINQLDVHPVDQQRSCAELAHPAPAILCAIASPQERQRQNQQNDSYLAEHLRRTIQPVVRFCVDRIGLVGEILACHDQAAAQ